MASDKRLARLVQELKGEVDTLVQGLQSGRLGAEDFHQSMEDLLTEGHLSAFLAAGGKDPDLVDSPVGRYIADQLDYLDRWAENLDPEDPRNPSRAGMYADAIRGSYSMGMTQGWPLPTYPGQDTDCLTRCQCEWNIVVISEARGDADAFWERHANDSCDTCTSFAGRYSPLRIRNGQALAR